VNGIPCNGLARLSADGEVDQTFVPQLTPWPPNNGIYVAEFAIGLVDEFLLTDNSGTAAEGGFCSDSFGRRRGHWV
jgi:hypothetical protein